jgi:hypothetical protein
MMNTLNKMNELSATELRGRLYLHSLEDADFFKFNGGKKYLDGFFWLDENRSGFVMFRPSGKVSKKHFRAIAIDSDIRYLLGVPQ